MRKMLTRLVFLIVIFAFLFCMGSLFISGSDTSETEDIVNKESTPVNKAIDYSELNKQKYLPPQVFAEVEETEQVSDTYILQTDEESIIVLCKMVWGEARGCSAMQQAGCVWCVLNRVDSDDPFYPDDIIEVVTQQYQFCGYNPGYPVEPEIRELVEDVLTRWEKEMDGEENVGRVLPQEYLWFTGDGVRNYFRDAYSGKFNVWDWSLENPYE